MTPEKLKIFCGAFGAGGVPPHSDYGGVPPNSREQKYFLCSKSGVPPLTRPTDRQFRPTEGGYVRYRDLTRLGPYGLWLRKRREDAGNRSQIVTGGVRDVCAALVRVAAHPGP